MRDASVPVILPTAAGTIAARPPEILPGAVGCVPWPF